MKVEVTLEKKMHGRTRYVATLKNDAGEMVGVGYGNAKQLAIGALVESCAGALDLEIVGPTEGDYERTGMFSNHN